MAPRKKTTAKKAKLPVPKPKPRTITPSKSIVRAVTTKKPNTGSSVAKTESKTKSRPSAQRVSKFTADQRKSTMKTSDNRSKFDNLLKRVRDFANNGDSKKAQKAIRASIGSDLKKADSKIVKVARTAGLTKIPTNVATTLFQGLSRRGIIGLLGSTGLLIGSAIYANKDDEEKIVKKANALEKKPAPEKKEEVASKPKKEAAPEPEKKKERTVISDSGGREDAKEKNVTPKRKPLEQGKRKIGDIIVDSTDKGMSKFSGFDNQEELEAEEEMNFRRGGTPSKRVYGAREGGFTKRGGMYKKGY